MKLNREEILRYPELHLELWVLCQSEMGPSDRLDCIDLITDDPQFNWREGVSGYKIRYHYNDRLMYWKTVDSHNSYNMYKKLSEYTRVILRDKKLESIGI